MSRGFHEACNTALRTAMADLFGFDRDGWTLLGCFDTGETLVWKPLTEIAQAVGDALARLSADAGVALAMDTELTVGFAGATFEDLPYLRGIAEVRYGSNDQGRHANARAVFDDAWRHLVSWKADEAAPDWELFSPPDVAQSPLATDTVLTGLLGAILGALELGHRQVTEAQRELSTCLRDLVAECNETVVPAVFLIVHRGGAWETHIAGDLTVQVGAKVESGMSVADAVGALAADIETDPPAVIPTLRGVGTIVHYDTEDGGAHASLVALCDQALHAASWVLGHDRPDWQILPVPAADPDYWAMVSAYTRLTDAIRGDKR
ncbi:hypothetical protein AB0B28_06475 [Glycomyces sp. NPDC046736]|uniref:hypothetical protein n=1 Tax=Glycomyces sp. NPDC046736 TaxID=3155615 RepID=UPI00341195AE